MTMMNYLFGLVVVFLVFNVLVLSAVVVPYYGVVVLMMVSFFCCIFMVFLGRTFAALVMYIVYLGGLVVVFGYCVSVEKGGVGGGSWVKWLVAVFLLVVIMCWLVRGDEGLLVYPSLENLVCFEVNGGGVLYCSGGAGLVVCSWGLLVVLFSILVILGWSRFGGFRSF